jgi:ATP synthase protein I
VVGVVLGYYCDRWLGTEPVFLFVFLILGFVAGFRRLLRIQVPRQENQGNGRDRGPDEPGG